MKKKLVPFSPSYGGTVVRGPFQSRCGVCANWFDWDERTKRQTIAKMKSSGWRDMGKGLKWVCRDCLTSHGHTDEKPTIYNVESMRSLILANRAKEDK